MPRLVRVHPFDDPGYRRVRSGSGFRYRDPRGHRIPAKDRTRIRELVIPPAWRDVWISARPNGHIQAVGTDSAGRRQYLYHADWARRQDRGKYERMLALAEALPRARARVTTALRGELLDRDRVLAVCFRLLDTVAPRIGSERYLAAHGSRGLTTLQCRDATVHGDIVRLSFPGKSGRRQLLEVEDVDLAAAVVLLAAGRPRSALLAWQRGRRRVPLRPAEVNAYVRAVTGSAFTAKDFRTLRGTVAAAESLARTGLARDERGRKHAEVLAVRAAADVLGNTPAVARGSYVDPRVFERYAEGALLDLALSPESAIRALLVPGPAPEPESES